MRVGGWSVVGKSHSFAKVDRKVPAAFAPGIGRSDMSEPSVEMSREASASIISGQFRSLEPPDRQDDQKSTGLFGQKGGETLTVFCH